jgi:hypothetical protein
VNIVLREQDFFYRIASIIIARITVNNSRVIDHVHQGCRYLFVNPLHCSIRVGPNFSDPLVKLHSEQVAIVIL